MFCFDIQNLWRPDSPFFNWCFLRFRMYFLLLSSLSYCWVQSYCFLNSVVSVEQEQCLELMRVLISFYCIYECHLVSWKVLSSCISYICTALNFFWLHSHLFDWCLELRHLHLCTSFVLVWFEFRQYLLLLLKWFCHKTLQYSSL